MSERPDNCDDLTCGQCFRCHISSVQISPAAMPSRAKYTESRLFNNNSWERGVAMHPSGMPFLGPDLDTIPLHHWQSQRSSYEKQFAAERAVDAHPPIPTAATDPAPVS